MISQERTPVCWGCLARLLVARLPACLPDSACLLDACRPSRGLSPSSSPSLSVCWMFCTPPGGLFPTSARLLDGLHAFSRLVSQLVSQLPPVCWMRSLCPWPPPRPPPSAGCLIWSWMAQWMLSSDMVLGLGWVDFRKKMYRATLCIFYGARFFSGLYWRGFALKSAERTYLAHAVLLHKHALPQLRDLLERGLSSFEHLLTKH